MTADLKRIVICGATSEIAMQTASLLANSEACFHLIARNQQKLSTFASDLLLRTGARVSTQTADLCDTASHRQLVATSVEHLGKIDLVLIAHGILGNQLEAQVDFESAHRILHTNFVCTVSLLTAFGALLEKQRSGTLAVISSVAGDRGRKSNYVYGASKGGLDVFLQGLRNRLFSSGVHVLTIKPGIVATPMTAHIGKGALVADSANVARDIVRALRRRSDVAYVPKFWRVIMAVIRGIPESVFKRLNF